MKNIFIAISIIITFSQVHAMKRTRVIKKNITQETAQEIDLFFLLKNIHNAEPKILDYIAQFLTFNDIESDQEFIERTKTRKLDPLPIGWKNHRPISVGIYPSLHAYSPSDNNISILLYDPWELWVGPYSTLMVIDTNKNEKLFDCHLGHNKSYRKLALSPDGTTFATIHTEPNLDDKWILTVKNIPTEKIEMYDANSLYEAIPQAVPNIAFNKQGTHVVLHDTNYAEYTITGNNIKKQPLQPPTFVQLSIETGCENLKQKKLENYFIQQIICKNLMLQLTAKT